MLFTFLSLATCLDNGLAKTPPMGWASWEQFKCTINCWPFPSICISEDLFVQHIDRIVEDGYLDAGYEFVNIDDCWMKSKRDSKTNRLVEDSSRFPHGIKWLADYAHSKGVKLGIYNDFGSQTCSGYAGSEGYLIEDAKTFSEWGIDFLKMDGCYSNPLDQNDAYPGMMYFLNKTGRPMVYSCSWPAYNMEMDYSPIPEFCNLWRNYVPDIHPNWESISAIIDYWGNQESWIQLAGPGHWNDPDFILVGLKHGLTQIESETQFAMWAILAAPLIMSNDLRNIDDWAKEILLNKEIIAVDQDKLGIQGRRISKLEEQGQVWVRQLENNELAVALLNRGDSKIDITAVFESFSEHQTFAIRDLYQHEDLGEFTTNFTANDVPAHGVRMLRLVPK
ncbi:hypothetical protein TRFO_01973 [Tritrichomonas foetus]|uniref:Alpha-galactosidase n=1 Tax=Tritrichomonas foetus TaxID=1144522 RepID=A0A1J4JHD0_9EUKA|nr:hypothetical protein TRFO_01973 [Tritrichomonas foetus]|eukprot:OHS96885.1 hypothetical protein TRFO_01973 [Tritrichomonas foetus]